MASGLFSQLISMGMTASWVILVVLAVRLLFQRLRLPKKYSYYPVSYTHLEMKKVVQGLQ